MALTGDTEQLAIGHNAIVACLSPVVTYLYSAPSRTADAEQAPHTHTMGNFKIRQLTPFRVHCSQVFRGIFPALQNGFVRNIQQEYYRSQTYCV